MSVLSDRLKALRESKGITQNAISEQLNIQRATYGMYEIGKSQPKPETLQKIAEYYGVTVDYLLGKDLDKDDIIIQKIKELTLNKKIKWDGLEGYNITANDYERNLIEKIINDNIDFSDDEYTIENQIKKIVIAFIAFVKDSIYLYVVTYTKGTYLILYNLKDEKYSHRIYAGDKDIDVILDSILTIRDGIWNRAKDYFLSELQDVEQSPPQ